MPFLPESIDILCDELSISQKELAEILETTPNMIYRWKYGITQPRIEFLDKLYSLTARNNITIEFYEKPGSYWPA